MKRRSPDAMVRTMGDEAVVLHVPSGEYFGLNAVGVLVWDLLDGSTDLDGVTERVTEAYDVDRATARHDVAALVDALDAAGLVVDDS